MQNGYCKIYEKKKKDSKRFLLRPCREFGVPFPHTESMR